MTEKPSQDERPAYMLVPSWAVWTALGCAVAGGLAWGFLIGAFVFGWP